MTENILIEFTADPSGLAPGVEALESVGKIDSNLATAFNKTNASIKEREKVIGSTSSAVNGLAENLKKADKATAGAFGKKALEDFKKVVGDSTTGVKLLQNTLATAKQKMDQLKQAGKEGSDEWKKLNQQFEDGQALLKQLNDEVKNTETKTKSLKTELRELKQALALMEDEGKEGTEEFKQMAIQAARLEDQLGDTQARIRAMASDTANVDALAQGFQTLAAGGQIAAGASALLGEENEDLQKTLVRLNAMMAITAGIREVINNLQKQSILRLKLEAAGQTILAVSNRITAGTFNLLGVSVAASATGFKVLRAAIITTGIGALVVGVTLLVTKLMEMSEATDEAEKELQEINDEFERGVNSIEAYNNALDRSTQTRLLEMKKLGATAKEMNDFEVNSLKSKLSRIIGEQNRYRDTYLQYAKDLSDESSKLTQKEGEMREKFIEDYKKQGEEEFALREQITQKKLEFEISANEKAEEERKKDAEKSKELAKRNAQAIFEIEERSLRRSMELLTEKIDNENSLYVVRVGALDEYHKLEQELLKLQKQYELSNSKLTADERKNIEDKFRIESEKSNHDYYKKRNLIIKTFNDQIVDESKAFYDQVAAQEAANIQKMLDSVKKIYAGIHKGNSEEEDRELQRLQNQFKNGEITLKDYEENRQKIKDLYAKRNLSNQQAELEANISNLKASGQDTTELEAQLYDVKEQLRQKDVDSSKKAEEKKEQDLKASVERRIMLVSAAMQIVTDISNAIFESDAADRQARLEAELKALDERKAKELDNKNLTEQQKEDIDKRYKAREMQIKKKAWMDEQKAKEQQAIINGALAITNILATMPKFDFGIASAIAIGAAIASTALQVSKIKSAKFPGLYRGTESAEEGIYRVGEIGRELMWHKDTGFQMLGNRGEELRFVPQGAQVFTAYETAQMMSVQPPAYEMPTSSPLPVWAEKQMSSQQAGHMELDYDKMGRAVARHVPKPVTNQINMDQNGFSNYILTYGNKTNIRNQRYTMNG
jgi:hypothetical protein